MYSVQSSERKGQMSLSIYLPVLISFFVSVSLGPVIIPFLKRLKAGQTIRGEGPRSHLKKNGTPTMGGILILSAVVAASLFYVKDYPQIMPVLLLTLGFGLIGFLDDLLKVVFRRSMGLTPLQKFSAQLVVTGLFVYYLVKVAEIGLAARIPFFPDLVLDLGWMNIPLAFFIILGTVNGANFTDGLDGLNASVTFFVCIFLMMIAGLLNLFSMSILAVAIAAGCMGFLVWNFNPAKVFMGDTGSLFLGGAVCALAFGVNMPVLLLPLGIVYFAEILSVVLQVGYFKLTHGKRLFKMSPIHHHFEMCGWSEMKVCFVFSLVAAIGGLIALALVFFGV